MIARRAANRTLLLSSPDRTLTRLRMLESPGQRTLPGNTPRSGARNPQPGLSAFDPFIPPPLPGVTAKPQGSAPSPEEELRGVAADHPVFRIELPLPTGASRVRSPSRSWSGSRERFDRTFERDAPEPPRVDEALVEELGGATPVLGSWSRPQHPPVPVPGVRGQQL